MQLPGMVVVKEEMHRLNADNVAAFLRSKGLDALVSSDDAGGEIPALEQTRFIQVLVPESEAEAAKELLAGFEETPGAAPTADEDDAPAGETDAGDDESE